MSKAEDLALKTYPVVMTTLIPADEEHPLIEQDCNKFTREAYIKGYHQAEKDLELTWEDLATIEKLGDDFVKQNHTPMSDEEFYKEVLKRFKAQKVDIVMDE